LEEVFYDFVFLEEDRVFARGGAGEYFEFPNAQLDSFKIYDKTHGIIDWQIENMSYKNGKVYSAHGSKGFTIFDVAQQKAIYTRQFNPPVNVFRIDDVAESETGKVFLATNYGIFTWNQAQDTIDWYNESPEMQPTKMLFINENNIWVGNLNEGIHRWNGSSWKWYFTHHGLGGNSTYEIALDSTGIIWAATSKGLSKFNGDTTWTNYNAASGLAGSLTWAVAVDPLNNVWVGTEKGVSYLNRQTNTWRSWDTSTGLPSNIIESIAISPKGDVVVGTNRGPARYQGSIKTTGIAAGRYSKATGPNLGVHHIGGSTLFTWDKKISAQQIYFYTLNGKLLHSQKLGSETEYVWKNLASNVFIVQLKHAGGSIRRMVGG